MCKNLTCLKVQNIFKKHSCYISRERRSAQLAEALARETLENEAGINLHMLQDTEHNKRAVRVGQVLGAVKDVARVYVLLHCEENAHLLSDKQIIAKLRNEQDMFVQTMARHRRLRIK